MLLNTYTLIRTLHVNYLVACVFLSFPTHEMFKSEICINTIYQKVQRWHVVFLFAVFQNIVNVALL